MQAFGRIICMSAILLVAACARPVADFGRQPDSVLSRQVLPGLERVIQPIKDSDLLLADQEDEMRRRFVRFFESPLMRDWENRFEKRLISGRIEEARYDENELARYYTGLRNQNFASSSVRYLAVARDIESDIMTIPNAFKSVCAVLELDRRRKIALAGVGGDEALAVSVERRVLWNKYRIAQFAVAISFRYDSYTYALERLLVETPDVSARRTDQQLSDMGQYVMHAENGQFCS